MTADTTIAVTGARLRYRLTGKSSALPVLVFENGWAASLEMWAWVERELAPHTRLLFYDRAGIGGSVLTQPQTPAGISRRLVELLDAVDLRTAVVVVGQSYGGLMCAVHAAQVPQRLRAIVQIDATPEFADQIIDKHMGVTGKVGSFLALLARLGIPEPLLSPAARVLPPESADNLARLAFRSERSLRNACDELALRTRLHDVAATPSGVQRLVISADAVMQPRNWFHRLIASSARARATIDRMQALHRRQAERGRDSRWEKLPYTHGDLVFTQLGAKATSARILEFLRQI